MGLLHTLSIFTLAGVGIQASSESYSFFPGISYGYMRYTCEQTSFYLLLICLLLQGSQPRPLKGKGKIFFPSPTLVTWEAIIGWYVHCKGK